MGAVPLYAQHEAWALPAQLVALPSPAAYPRAVTRSLSDIPLLAAAEPLPGVNGIPTRRRTCGLLPGRRPQGKHSYVLIEQNFSLRNLAH